MGIPSSCNSIIPFAECSTKDATSFGISRTLDVNGANSHVTSTREATLYGVDILRNKLAMGIDVLDQIGTKHAFKVRN